MVTNRNHTITVSHGLNFHGPTADRAKLEVTAALLWTLGGSAAVPAVHTHMMCTPLLM